MLRLFLLIFLAQLSSSLAADEKDPSLIEFTLTRISGPIYLLEGPDIRDKSLFNGGNIAVSLGKDGLLLVDSKIAPVGKNVLLALNRISKEKVRFLLNTHHHNDHVGGNAALSDETTTLIAHDNVHRRLVKDKPEELWPILTFSESLSLHLNGEEISVIHVPNGHTDSDVIVHFTQSNVVHMGDYLFSGMFPVIDLKSGGNVQRYLENTRKVLDDLPRDVKIIPGHGALATWDDLQNNYRMLLETTNLIKQKMQDSKSLEQIKREGLPNKWATWAWWRVPPEEWIETIYNSYSTIPDTE